jgi:hypothetical protein
MRSFVRERPCHLVYAGEVFSVPQFLRGKGRRQKTSGVVLRVEECYEDSLNLLKLIGVSPRKELVQLFPKGFRVRLR